MPTADREKGTLAKDQSRAGSNRSKLWRVLGPGLITGASDDDPSGIATYSQAGAQFGFAITWTMLFTYPLMCVIQEVSGRIGRTTGIGIAGNLRKHYSNWLLLPVVGALSLANTINIGANLGAMGDALMLLSGGHISSTFSASPLSARSCRSSCRTPATWPC